MTVSGEDVVERMHRIVPVRYRRDGLPAMRAAVRHIGVGIANRLVDILLEVDAVHLPSNGMWKESNAGVTIMDYAKWLATAMPWDLSRFVLGCALSSIPSAAHPRPCSSPVIHGSRRWAWTPCGDHGGSLDPVFSLGPDWMEGMAMRLLHGLYVSRIPATMREEYANRLAAYPYYSNAPGTLGLMIMTDMVENGAEIGNPERFADGVISRIGSFYRDERDLLPVCVFPRLRMYREWRAAVSDIPWTPPACISSMDSIAWTLDQCEHGGAPGLEGLFTTALESDGRRDWSRLRSWFDRFAAVSWVRRGDGRFDVTGLWAQSRMLDRMGAVDGSDRCMLDFIAHETDAPAVLAYLDLVDVLDGMERLMAADGGYSLSFHTPVSMMDGIIDFLERGLPGDMISEAMMRYVPRHAESPE